MHGFERIDFMGNIITDDSNLGYEVEEENAEVKETCEEVENESKPMLFFKTYNNSILEAVGKLTGHEGLFMLAVCAMMSWDNRVVFNKAVRQKLMFHLNVSEKTIRNTITSLCKKDFLKRVDVKTYVVNDSFFTKQAEPDIKAKRKAGRISVRIQPANDDDII